MGKLGFREGNADPCDWPESLGVGVCQAEGAALGMLGVCSSCLCLRAAFPDHLCRPFLLHRGIIRASVEAIAIFCLAWHLGWESLLAEKLMLQQWFPVPGTWLALSVFSWIKLD